MSKLNVAYLCPSKHWENAQMCTDEERCVLCENDRLKKEVECWKETAGIEASVAEEQIQAYKKLKADLTDACLENSKIVNNSMKQIGELKARIVELEGASH